ALPICSTRSTVFGSSGATDVSGSDSSPQVVSIPTQTRLKAAINKKRSLAVNITLPVDSASSHHIQEIHNQCLHQDLSVQKRLENQSAGQQPDPPVVSGESV